MIILKYFVWVASYPEHKATIYEVITGELLRHRKNGTSNGVKHGRIVTAREAKRLIADYGLVPAVDNQFGCIWK